ncbi:MAG: LysM peptidoglycan-binding domain-containing protein [Barnesiella sp.]|nr:LysM peptidoglycan-binding domain-containing protein [Barnesiella sp.]MBD5344230.1 LysM peptidoglycan-binding domain-containing protein [Bacteroides sp.]
MKATVKERQTLLDIALLTGGHIETVFALAEANGMSITDQLEDGRVLTVPEPVEGGDTRTVELYKAHKIEPATEVSPDDMSACPYGGIGFMGIEIDFIVS